MFNKLILFVLASLFATNADAQRHMSWCHGHYAGHYSFVIGRNRVIQRHNIQTVPTTVVIVNNYGNQDSYYAEHPSGYEVIDYYDDNDPVYYTPQREVIEVEWTLVFDRNRWAVRNPQDLDNIANFANRYPQARFEIYSYADVETGTDARNYRLSEYRSREVVKDIASIFGVPENRFTLYNMGSKVQPYQVNDWNRCAIVRAIID